MSARTTARNKQKLKKTTRFGGAAFAIGLYLAGPQVALAVADTPDDTMSGPAKEADASGPKRATVPAPTRAARPAAAEDRAGAALRAAGPPAGSDVDDRAAAGRADAQVAERSGRVAPARIAGGASEQNDRTGPRAAGEARPHPASAASARQVVTGPAATINPVTAQQNSSAVDAGSPVVPVPAEQSAKPAAAAVSLPSALPPIPPVLEQIDAQIQSAVVGIFHGIVNIVSTLPVNPVTSWLEGGLLMLRKSFFNQTASVSAIQTGNSAQLVTGKIDLVDPEGDGWAIDVVEAPTHGTVVLGATSQGNGIGTTKYTYTPGEGYTGTDHFIIRVTPTDSVFNVFHPFGLLNTRYYTVEVGDAAEAAKTCFACQGSPAKDTLDTTLFLANVGATVSVQKQGTVFPQYQTTVTLSNHAANQSFAWMDIRGRTGTVGVDQMLTEDWAAFVDKAGQNAVKPVLAFVYSDQGVDKSVFVDVDAVSKNADGTYTFSGQLMENLPAQGDRIDAWDYLGIGYKNSFENFIASSGLANCASGAVCAAVTTVGILAATTLSPSAYREVGGHDYVLPTPNGASANQTVPGSIGPGTVGQGEGTGTGVYGNTGNGTTELTSIIPWGTDGSFIFGTNLAQSSTSNNGVGLFTANAPAGSQPTWAQSMIYGNGWDAAVNVMAAWDQLVVDTNGQVIPATFSGTVTSGSNVVTLSLTNNTLNPALLVGETITGHGIADGTKISSFYSASGNTATYLIDNWSTTSTGTVTITTPNVGTYQPGLLVGLSDGSVQYWNGGGCSQTAAGCDTSTTSQAYGQGWTQLQASNAAGWGSDVAVNSLITLPNGEVVVGLSNGQVYYWDSYVLADGTIVAGPNAGSGCSGASPGDCWTQPQGATDWGSAVTAMIPSGQGGGFIAGLANGSVYQWIPGGEIQQLGSSFSSEVTALLPYDGISFVGAIAGVPVIADNGVISAPSWAPDPSWLAPYTTSCQSSYNSGTGTGCGGYLLTVQQAVGDLSDGLTLYGGAGLAAGTRIIHQISDGNGISCLDGDTCDSGGVGVYLVDTAQLVAPGSPMFASDGSGVIVGLDDGSVQLWNPYANTFTQLQDSGWGSSLNAVLPWRDGFVVGLDDGAVFYWSPSNNPDGNNPDNPYALTYQGSTVSSQSAQGQGWSQLQGTGWDNAVTSMVPIGDGFALGLTAPNKSNNGAIMLFTGYGPPSTTTAFGYTQSSGGPVASTASNSFTQIAGQSDLSGNSSYGSVQQMIPVTGYVTDSSGNLVLGQSVIAGLTNNGIYVWTGSAQNTSTTSWATLQQPGTGGKPTLTATQLQAAWGYGNAASSDTVWGATGGVGATYVAASGSAPASGDPVFGLSTNQAWCGSSCGSHGDYSPLVHTNLYGTDGSILSFGSTVETNVDLSSITYGYVFYPNSVIDKFLPGKYSVGMLVAFQGGPTVTLNMDGNASATVTENVTGPSESWYEPTEVGTFGLTVGLNAGVTAGIDLTNAPSGPVQLGQALYTPGMLYTWNVNGYTKNMSLSFDYYPMVSHLTESEAANYLGENATLTITPEVTPYTTASYGLFTPPKTPIIGEWTVFSVGVGYQNPVSFTLSAPVSNPADLAMSVTSQGFVTANAGFLPDVTSLLTWNGKFQVYSVTDQIQT